MMTVRMSEVNDLGADFSEENRHVPFFLLPLSFPGTLFLFCPIKRERTYGRVLKQHPGKLEMHRGVISCHIACA